MEMLAAGDMLKRQCGIYYVLPSQINAKLKEKKNVHRSFTSIGCFKCSETWNMVIMFSSVNFKPQPEFLRFRLSNIDA